MSTVPRRWLAAAVAVAALSMGLSGILKFALSMLAFVGGLVVVVYAAARSEGGEKLQEALRHSSQKWFKLK
jgi:hypothetical protein